MKILEEISKKVFNNTDMLVYQLTSSANASLLAAIDDGSVIIDQDGEFEYEHSEVCPSQNVYYDYLKTELERHYGNQGLSLPNLSIHTNEMNGMTVTMTLIGKVKLEEE